MAREQLQTEFHVARPLPDSSVGVQLQFVGFYNFRKARHASHFAALWWALLQNRRRKGASGHCFAYHQLYLHSKLLF